jgi:hypothetical protein
VCVAETAAAGGGVMDRVDMVFPTAASACAAEQPVLSLDLLRFERRPDRGRQGHGAVAPSASNINGTAATRVDLAVPSSTEHRRGDIVVQRRQPDHDRAEGLPSSGRPEFSGAIKFASITREIFLRDTTSSCLTDVSRRSLGGAVVVAAGAHRHGAGPFTSPANEVLTRTWRFPPPTYGRFHTDGVFDSVARMSLGTCKGLVFNVNGVTRSWRPQSHRGALGRQGRRCAHPVVPNAITAGFRRSAYA